VGIVRDVTGRELRLASRNLVGRSRRCELQLASASTSSVHAIIRWTRGGWQLRDLGSRYGTYVNGRLVGAGEGVVVAQGDELRFGEAPPWRLVSEAEPELFARRGDGLTLSRVTYQSEPSAAPSTPAEGRSTSSNSVALPLAPSSGVTDSAATQPRGLRDGCSASCSPE